MAVRAHRMLVYGDINVDVHARMPAPLEPGGDNLFKALDHRLGGVGANTAIALARWGNAAGLLGCVGEDSFGEFALTALRECGIFTQYVSCVDAPTGLFFIPIDPDGRRTLIGSRGANTHALSDFSPDQLLDGIEWLHLTGYGLLSDETAPLLYSLAQHARRRIIGVSLDVGLAPAQQAGQAILRLAPELDVMFVGLEEAEALTRQRGEEVLSALTTIGVGEVILKRGAGGCQYFQSGRWWRVPPFPVEAVDATGAGDAFAAGFLVGKLRKWSMSDSVLLANAMGASAAATLGAGTAMPGVQEVLGMLESVPADDPAAALARHLLTLLRNELNSDKVKVPGGSDGASA